MLASHKELIWNRYDIGEVLKFIKCNLFNFKRLIQDDFENNVKAVLRSAHIQYMKRVENGEDPDLVLDELVYSSLDELRNLSEK